LPTKFKTDAQILTHLVKLIHENNNEHFINNSHTWF